MKTGLRCIRILKCVNKSMCCKLCVCTCLILPMYFCYFLFFIIQLPFGWLFEIFYNCYIICSCNQCLNLYSQRQRSIKRHFKAMATEFYTLQGKIYNKTDNPKKIKNQTQNNNHRDSQSSNLQNSEIKPIMQADSQHGSDFR